MILDGKEIAGKLKEQLAQEIKTFESKVQLMVILVGSNEASVSYVNSKEKACKLVGIKCKIVKLDENVNQKEVVKHIQKGNEDENVHGIMIQLPLPSHLDEKAIIDSINPKKDVDGLTIYNQGRLFNNLPAMIPATPKGIMHLLDSYHINVKGLNALVIGRSNLVTKPLAMLLLKRDATVTIAHSKTTNLRDLIKNADIVVSAVGIHDFIKADMIKIGAIIIDVGISRYNARIVGDVSKDVLEVSSYMTPVPGGVGPMTIACLLENTVECYKNK